MVAVYVTLIIHGLRTYNQVPLVLKAKVKEALIACDMADAITEE